MSRRFVITGLLGSAFLVVAALAPALEEQDAATQKPAPAAAAPAQTAPAAAPAAPTEPTEPEPVKFSAAKLDEMVGPVALYPDPLLIQVLIASTYPLEIVEADRWRQKNKDLKDDALATALEQQDWDPSVEGLAQFPDLLKRMSDNLDWTKDLGDAFLAQQDDVLNAVQRMRKLAADAGSLQTTKQQTVTKEVVNSKETIIIEPAEPQTVYVPTYPPQAYGTAAPPPAYYPAAYGYPPGYTGSDMMMASMLSFGVGIGVGALIDGGCDWDDHEVYCGNCGGGGGKKNSDNTVNIERNKEVNRGDRTVNRGDRGDRGGDRQRWQHNPEHRRNVGYRDQGTAKRFEGSNPDAARQRQAREAARGYDRGDAQRPASATQRPASGSQRPGAAGAGTRDVGRADQRAGSRDAAYGDRGAGGSARADRGGADRGASARPASRPASHGGREGAFGGYGDAGATRAASQRGASSRGGTSWAGSGGGGGGGGGGGWGGGGGGGSRGGGGRGGGGRGGGGRGGGGRR